MRIGHGFSASRLTLDSLGGIFQKKIRVVKLSKLFENWDPDYGIFICWDAYLKESKNVSLSLKYTLTQVMSTARCGDLSPGVIREHHQGL